MNDHRKICPICGADYQMQAWERPGRFARRLTCGRKCASVMRTSPFAARFASHTKRNPASGCLEWQSYTDSWGYGRISQGPNGEVLAHRVAFILAHGPIPAGLYICHHCDNPKCVEPTHLYAGTAKDNTRDAVARHRFPDRKGGKNVRAKLTPDQIREIRLTRRKGAVVAKEYGVHRGTITAIRSRRTWGHVA